MSKSIVRWRNRRLRRASGALLALTATVIAASVAFACTTVMGPLTMSPTSGVAGTRITTSASGLKLNAKYELHFAKTTSGNCMSFSGVITLAKPSTDGSGAWSNVSAVIPSTATRGTHGVCAMELTPVKAQTGTTHDFFTVT